MTGSGSGWLISIGLWLVIGSSPSSIFKTPNLAGSSGALVLFPFLLPPFGLVLLDLAGDLFLLHLLLETPALFLLGDLIDLLDDILELFLKVLVVFLGDLRV
jgi:hypothetical protein